MIEKLEGIDERFAAIQEQLCDPAVVSDQKLYAELMKETKHLTPIVEAFAAYKKTKSANEEARELLNESGTDVLLMSCEVSPKCTNSPHLRMSISLNLSLM